MNMENQPQAPKGSTQEEFERLTKEKTDKYYLDKKKKITESITDEERLIIKKLDSLYIEYLLENRDGKLVYRFFGVEKASPFAFWLKSRDKKILLQTLHFDDGKFKDPETKKEISFKELSKNTLNKFPDADEIIYSCCHPDDARKNLLINGDDFFILGAGSSEYKTIYNNRENFITISSV